MNDEPFSNAIAVGAKTVAYDVSGVIASGGLVAGCVALLTGAALALRQSHKRKVAAKTDLRVDAVAPVQRALESSTGLAQEVMRRVATSVGQDVEQRAVHGNEARIALAEAIRHPVQVMKDDAKTAAVIERVMNWAFTHDGAPVKELSEWLVDQLVKELQCLPEEPRMSLAKTMRERLYDGCNRAIPKMSNRDALRLLDVLTGVDLSARQPQIIKGS